MRRPIARIQLNLLIALSVAVPSLVACKRNGDRPVHTEMPEAQPRVTIVYDRMYSNVAVTGYLTMHPCPSQSSEMCEHNARDQESAFYAKFATAFQFVPACSGLSLIALDSPGGDSPNTTEKLFRVPTKAQWKLNVSFTPGHEKQAWSMAPMTKLNNSSGEGDAHSMAQTVCLIAKEAGGQVVE